MKTLFKSANNMWISSYRNGTTYLTRNKQDALSVEVNDKLYDILVSKDYIPSSDVKFLFKHKTENIWIAKNSDLANKSYLWSVIKNNSMEIESNSIEYYQLYNLGCIPEPAVYKQEIKITQDRSIILHEID